MRHVVSFSAFVLLGCTSLGCGETTPAASVTTTSGAAEAADGGPGSGEGGDAVANGGKARGGEGAAPPKDLPTLPSWEGKPPVDLEGTADTTWPPPLDGAAPKIAALAIDTPVFSQPDVYSARLGTLRTGAIVEVDPRPLTGKGCSAGMRRIKPLGYVCLSSTTLDLETPIVRASTRRPDHTGKLPYMYGMAVKGGPAYGHLPNAEHLEQLEPHLPQHLRMWTRDKVNGSSYGQEIWAKWKTEPQPAPLLAMAERRTDAALPWYVKDGARLPNLSGAISNHHARAGEFSRHNGIAFVDTFLWSGRRYNVSVDLRLMPADRFRPIKGSEFHGVRIGTDIQPPFAFVKGRSAHVHKAAGPKRLVRTQEEIAWRSVVKPTGQRRVHDGRTFAELEGDQWILLDALAPVEIAKKMPPGSTAGEKWIDVSILQQVLVAYEGLTPVYATMVSTGEAGLGDPKTTRSTVLGAFRINTKFITATMDSDVVGEEFELRDVPYVQYFKEGYALHASYWHDVFGQPKSHGCINLAPEDARRLFYWTEPRVPPHWHGASKAMGTVVLVRPGK